jgi:carbonic anhydrase
MLTKMKSGLDQSRLEHVYDPRARDRETVVTNVRAQLNSLTEDQSIMSKVRSEDLVVVGAFYEISSGIVDFFDEISSDDLAPVASDNGGGESSEGGASDNILQV